MRIFAQKQNQPQKPVSSSLARSNIAKHGLGHREHPLLNLQRIIGNQAVQRMLQTHAEELEIGSTGTAASRSAHDFSRIPVHASVAGTIQAKLTVNTPGDIYEEEADTVAEQVMRMTTPLASNVQRQTEAEKRIQRKTIGDGQPLTAPPIVHEVLRSSGQPLDAATRGFMEPRFGHNFGHVRVHTDTRAAESARAVNALAYTVGRDVVFGAGRYEPGTAAGDRLLAHELTHVVQQPSALQRQPATDDPPVLQPKDPLPTVWVDDERRRNDKRYAQRLGREDAARVRPSAKLRLELRQEINAKLRFFEGDAWEAYGQEVKPALQELLHPQKVVEMDPEFAADDRKRGDKKFALQIGQEDATQIRNLGKVSGEFRQGLNAKLRFFEGDARDVYEQQIKAAIDQIVPSVQELRDFCTPNINDVWGAQNQGLEDFEHQLGSDIDYGAVAASLLGNLIWAGACFATGEAAFVISIIGIGVGTAGPLIPHVKDQPSFHNAARKQIDDLKTQADARIDAIVKNVREEALKQGWDGSKVRQELLKRLLKPEYIKVLAGGMPVLDLPAVAASVEKELLFRAATTPWKDWAGWKKGNAWLEFDYTLDETEKGLFKPVAPSSWPPAKANWIWIFPLGNAEIPDLNNRLNTLYDEVLHQPKNTENWPIRKVVNVLIRRAGRVSISFGKDSSFQGWSTDIDDRYIKGWLNLAGMEGDSKEKFPELLLDHLWKKSGGKPPMIEKLFIGG
jgi:hypothetical protein